MSNAIDRLDREMAQYEKPGRNWWQWAFWGLFVLLIIACIIIGVLLFTIVPPPHTPTPTRLPRQTRTVTATMMPSQTVTQTLLPTFTSTVKATATATATETETPTPDLSQALTDTSTPTITATTTPILTATIANTVAPTLVPTNTLTPVPVNLFGLVSITPWPKLCPYVENAYYDLPPFKVELKKPDEWGLLLENYGLYLVRKDGSARYLLSIGANGKPVNGFFGKGFDSARSLSYFQCGTQNMDQESYFWLPSFDEPAVGVAGYDMQLRSGSLEVSEVVKISITMAGNVGGATQLYFFPITSTDEKLKCSTCSPTGLKCVLKTDTEFYGVRMPLSRRLYWVFKTDITGKVPDSCKAGFYTGSLTVPDSVPTLPVP